MHKGSLLLFLPLLLMPTHRVVQRREAVADPTVSRMGDNWPSFRGSNATGIADGQDPPVRWDVRRRHEGMWRTPIPGLGLSSPVVWGDRVFVTTAISSSSRSEFRPGQYGSITPARDRSKHTWKVYCIDRRTGKILWERTAHQGVPQVRRHPKSSHANATPVTDGKHLVVSFASEGLYCYDFAGKLLWQRDLGVLDAGSTHVPEAQWEAASSPILHRGLVIVQCDRQEDSYLAAFDVATGKRIWRTSRDEPPSWGTPTVVGTGTAAELITNGSNAIRGYDPLTGTPRWRLRRSSQITVPTPFAADGLVFVTSGYQPIQPIWAIRPGGRGDITPRRGEDSSDHIAWSRTRGGPYLPTPIAYRGLLYVVSNSGQLTCYRARSGQIVYREWLDGDNGFTASPVVADGRLYFTGEDGQVHVVQAGPTFRRLAVNDLRETCLATPAIAGGMLFFRTQKHLLGIGRP